MWTPKTLLLRLRGSPFAFPLAALAALAMFAISEASYREAASTFDELGQQGVARVQIQTLWRSALDAETGQRGYLLTGRKEYLEPYTAAQGQIARSLDWLGTYYAADPAAAALTAQLRAATRTKLDELVQTIALKDADRAEASLAPVASGLGKARIDAIRSLSERLLAQESAKVATARRGLSQTLMLNRVGVTAMTALSLLALYMYLRQTRELARQREQQRRIVLEERDLLGLQVERRTEQLTELARHLQALREDERDHLARELHDELGALLTAAKLDVARLKSRLGAPQREVAERLVHLNDGLNQGIALKRRIIEDLRPSSLGNLGLPAALEILVREWGGRSDIVVEHAFEPVRLAPSSELTVYRLVQEALTNIGKHASATEVKVAVSADQGRVHVLVRDNGVGFDVDSQRPSSFGLLGMHYRLQTDGGQLTLISSPGRGTSIRAELPESTDGTVCPAGAPPAPPAQPIANAGGSAA